MSVPRRFHGHGLPSLVTTTTANRRRIFAADDAASALASVIREVIHETRVGIYAYVIMPDHLHVVLAAPKRTTVGKVVGLIKGRFARRWNHKSGTSGHVWQERFHERVLRSERGLEEAVLYVHMNPVKDGIVSTMEDYRWSSAYASVAVD